MNQELGTYVTLARDVFFTAHTSYFVHIILKILYVRFAFAKVLFSPLCITRIVLFQDSLYGVGILYSIIIVVHSVNFKLGYFVVDAKYTKGILNSPSPAK